MKIGFKKKAKATFNLTKMDSTSLPEIIKITATATGLISQEQLKQILVDAGFSADAFIYMNAGEEAEAELDEKANPEIGIALYDFDHELPEYLVETGNLKELISTLSSYQSDLEKIEKFNNPFVKIEVTMDFWG